MILNACLHSAPPVAAATPLLLIHGLFGSLDNTGILARGLNALRPTLQVDVRNHGLSPRSDSMDYRAMARDMLDTLTSHHIDKVTAIGHSMGGKIAMALCALAPERIEQLVVIDIAPVNYPADGHDAVFAAIHAVSAAATTRRIEAAKIMRGFIKEENVIQFLLKSFHHGVWRFNATVLQEHYNTLASWQDIPAWSGPALFIRGENSPWLDERWRPRLLKQFPAARGCVIAGAGHWVHAEKPDSVLRAIRRFLFQPPETG